MESWLCMIWIEIVHPGGRVLHHIFSNCVQPVIKNLTQLDLRFFKNEKSKRSKINEKVGQLDQKSRRKFIQMFKYSVKFTRDSHAPHK